MSRKKLTCFIFFLLSLCSASRASDKFQELYDSAKKSKSINLAKLSLVVAQELKNNELTARAYFLMAYYQNKERDYYESLKNFFSALKYYERAENAERIVSTLHSIGNIYYRSGFFERAIESYGDGIKLAKEMNDIGLELSLRREIAMSYRAKKEYKQAEKQYLDLIPQFLARGNELQVSQCYLGLGYISTKTGKSYDTANYYYSQAVNIFSVEGKNKAKAALKRKNSLAYMCNLKGLFKKAKVFLTSALEQAQKDTYENQVMADIYFNLGDTYQYLGIGDSAILMYEKGIEHIDTEAFDFDYAQSIKGLYGYCRTFNPAESEACSKVIYDFTEEVVEFKDKLVNANAHYQVAAANLHRENELLNAQQQRDRRVINFMIFLALGLVILAGLIFYLYERKRRIQKWRKVLKELTIKPSFTNPS